MDGYLSWLVYLMLGVSTGCAGNGEGLDRNGQPLGDGSVPPSPGSPSTPGGSVTADFQSIQDNVFTPICAKCHIGGSAPEGLQLDSAHSYNLLIGMPSAEQPSLQRVKVSDPDDSYMVRKIEGIAGIDGGQMPLGQTPLPQATIAAIRQWITNGAPNARAPAALPATQFSVQTTVPEDHGTTSGSAPIVVAFTQDVDTTLVNESTVSLERLTGAALAVPTTSVAAKGNGAVLLIAARTRLEAGKYRLTLRGSGGGALANMSATPLGNDVSVEFTVEKAP